MNPVQPTPPGAAGGSAPARTQVRALAQQLEGVFLSQLFAAMRATVPKDGAIGQAPGEELFTQLFDERIASQSASHLSPRLTEALVRQLTPRPNPTSEKP